MAGAWRRAPASAGWWRSRGLLPRGYYKDQEKTAKTFKVIEGMRWSVPGDWAEVNADGSLKLLGRGSVCINTGGEKVFPEEVEEALKTHPGVRDAVVVGLPDARFGERICAVVETDGAARADAWPNCPSTCAATLAGYKAPRDLVLVESHRPRPQRQGRLQGRSRTERLPSLGSAPTMSRRLRTNSTRAARGAPRGSVA